MKLFTNRGAVERKETVNGRGLRASKKKKKLVKITRGSRETQGGATRRYQLIEARVRKGKKACSEAYSKPTRKPVGTGQRLGKKDAFQQELGLRLRTGTGYRGYNEKNSSKCSKKRDHWRQMEANHLSCRQKKRRMNPLGKKQGRNAEEGEKGGVSSFWAAKRILGAKSTTRERNL